MIIEFIQLLSQGITIICFIHIFRLNLKLMKICRELMDITGTRLDKLEKKFEDLKSCMPGTLWVDITNNKVYTRVLDDNKDNIGNK